MSKIIKYAVWQEEPRYIGEVPEPESEPEEEKEDAGEEAAEKKPSEPEGPKFDEEAQAQMLAEVAAKEERAEQMLQEAREASESLREEAQAEHDRIIAEAQAEVEKLKAAAKEEAHAEGLAEGHEEGLAKAREEMERELKDSTAKAEHVMQTAKEAMKEYVVQAEHEIVTIAMEVVEKILPQHFIDVPQAVLPLVRETIKRVSDQKEIIIRVAPDCYDVVLMARDEFRAMLEGGSSQLEVKTDESLKPGDCVLETPNGSVDARLSTQLGLIEKAVRDVML